MFSLSVHLVSKLIKEQSTKQNHWVNTEDKDLLQISFLAKRVLHK